MIFPPPLYSGTNTSKLDSSLGFIYDSASGGYRAITPRDYAGGTGSFNGATENNVGLSYARFSNLNNTGKVIKASAGNLYAVNLINNSSFVTYVKFYNKPTAPSGTNDSGVLFATYPIAAGIGGSTILRANEVPIRYFSSGIGVLAVSGISDTDSTAPTNGVIAEITYR